MKQIDKQGEQIIKDLMHQIDDYSLSCVEDACEYLGHPLDEWDEFHRCFCRAKIPGEEVKVMAIFDFKENNFSSKYIESAKLWSSQSECNTNKKLLITSKPPEGFDASKPFTITITTIDDEQSSDT